MGLADLDYHELHLSVLDYFTGKPYLDDQGRTTRDLGYESIEVVDEMFEAKATNGSTAKIVLPSLAAHPALRPLLSQIKEGNRVELYNFQPDCGDPVFAGFIPPNGITEQDGKTIVDVQDTMGQLRWQHLRRVESLNAPASGLYTRGLSVWQDFVVEDFAAAANPQSYLLIQNVAGTPTWGDGYVLVGGSTNAETLIQSQAIFTINPGDVWRMDADAVFNTAFPVAGALELLLWFRKTDLSATGVGGFVVYQPSGVVETPQRQIFDFIVNPPGGPNYQTSTGTNAASYTMPQSHHLTVYLRFDAVGTVTLNMLVDGLPVASVVQFWLFDQTPYYLEAGMASLDPTESIQLTSWRAARLTQVLPNASQFNAQTQDAIQYQPNNEDNLSFLQLIAEKDGAEYRPIYRPWPALDEVELDASGTLGAYASRTLGYDMPGGRAVQASPSDAGTDTASFLVAPPFRFDEGYNLEVAPSVNPRDNTHANDVLRVGSSTTDAQVSAEKLSVSEIGRPQAAIAGSFPVFEQLTNDDRIGLYSLSSTLAQNELTLRTDGIPSLDLVVVPELPYTGRWRAGDTIYVKTQSLRSNLEQEMRLARRRYSAGAPRAEVTMGRLDKDPALVRQMSEAMTMAWLYDQSGTSPAIYVYPTPGNIAAGATSAVFTIPLDQYTTGTALVYAAIHWFADANVLKVNPVVNGNQVYLTGLSSPSGTDSGLVLCTQYFQAIGTYTLAFTNNDSVTRNLSGAFLVLRLKG